MSTLKTEDYQNQCTGDTYLQDEYIQSKLDGCNKKNDETWVLQFSPDASLAMMSDTDSFIQTLAEDAVRNTINGQYKIMHSGIFKWKYALCSRSNLNNEYTYISKDAFAIGDWNLSPRVESAYISGNELGKYLTKNIL